MSQKSPIEIVFGGASIGAYAHWLNTPREVEECLAIHSAKGYNSVDTALIYGAFVYGFGKSEELLGEAKAAEKGWIIDTKANSWIPGGHSPETLRASLESSLERLKVKKVRTYYLHCPGDTSPLLRVLQTIDSLYKENLTWFFGVSNFLPKDVEELVRLSEEYNLVKVSVYQGQYNAMSRNTELKLFPVLKKHNIGFYCYSPTAGGFFHEKHITNPDAEGRFHGDNQGAILYRKTYHKPEYFEALKAFHATLKKYPGSDPIDIALRWLVYHTPLGDFAVSGVILGGSNKKQLEQNVASVDHGPLDQWAVDALDELWDKVKDVAPPEGWAIGEMPF